MTGQHLLRKQVAVEIRRRRITVTTVLILSFLYLCATFIFGNTGLLRYLELRDRKVQLEQEVQNLAETNRRLRTEVKLLRENPFYIEKHAREEFGMARPDEYVFKYER